MHLHARYTGAELLIEGVAAPPFGPGFTALQVADADTLEVVWRLLKAGKPIAMAQVGGC